jgi:hypothetical protein
MTGEKTRILILVKTYPVLSDKYAELVCTAGIKEDGTWIRIYPVPFRWMEQEKKYQKYQWIEVPITRNNSDVRPESHKVTNIDQLELMEKIDTKHEWYERKKLLLEKVVVFDDLSKLIKVSKETNLSLAMFKPTKIKKFVIEKADNEWDSKKLEKIFNTCMQPSLFDSEKEKYRKENYQVTKKVPYKFSYTFEDCSGRESTMMIEDWEIGQLYWNTLESCCGDEKCATEKVKEKYLDEFINKKDIWLFLGTTKQYHGWALNPFIIIGVFYPPKPPEPLETLFI